MKILKAIAILSILLFATANIASATVFEQRISKASGGQDAEERSDGSVYMPSSDLELTFQSSTPVGNQVIGLRYSNITIPNGASITNAYVQFWVDEVTSEPTSLVIRAEKAGNSSRFLSQVNNISARPLTTAAVNWSPPPWTVTHAGDVDQRTPDLSSVIQEIVNQPDWAIGNDLSVIIGGTGQRIAESANGKPSEAPLLHIEYSLVPDTEPPVASAFILATSSLSNRTNVVWDPFTDNTGVTDYTVYRCTGAQCTLPDNCTSYSIIAQTQDTYFTDTGLQPDTLYTYRIVGHDAANNSSIQCNGASVTTLAEGVFVSQTLVGAGDIAESGSILSNNGKTASLVETVIQSNNDTIVFTTGDNAYTNGTAADFLQKYDPTWGRFRLRTFPTPGNHDYNSPGATGYLNYFCSSSFDCVFPSGTQDSYYAVSFGDEWRIYFLDSERVTQAQVDWLAQDLASNPGKCIAAVWHHPLYSSGFHGSLSNGQQFWDLLYAAGADFVVNGHEHSYETFAKQDGSGNLYPNGIKEFVVGTGGRALRSFPTVQPNSEVRYNTSHGVIKFTLNQGGYRWEFIPTEGSFVNTGSQVCNYTLTDPIPNQAPVANAGVDISVPDINPDGLETIALNGSLSTDSDGNIATYSWTEGGVEIGTGPNPVVSLGFGLHTVVLTVIDNLGSISQDTVIVDIVSSCL